MENTNIFMQVLFYWLAGLPILVAILVWLYFWRQKQLIRRMIRLEKRTQRSSGKPCVSIIDLLAQQEQPRVHSNNQQVVICVEEMPLPSYTDATKTTPPPPPAYQSLYGNR